MPIVIFGGDNLGKIPLLLENHGFQLVQHITGRKRGDIKICIPQEAEGVLVLTDYINHQLAKKVKAAAKEQGIQAIFARRSWSRISKELENLKIS